MEFLNKLLRNNFLFPEGNIFFGKLIEMKLNFNLYHIPNLVVQNGGVKKLYIERINWLKTSQSFPKIA